MSLIYWVHSDVIQNEVDLENFGVILKSFISDSVIFCAEKLKTFSEINFPSTLVLTESIVYVLEHSISADF